MRVLALCALILPLAAGPLVPPPSDWPSSGGDPGGSRHSPLTQIDRANVAGLEVAWTFHTGEAGITPRRGRPPALETTPLVVEGTMYLSTPLGRAIALDPATGRERWRYDPGVDSERGYGDFASRGVSYWRDGRAPASATWRDGSPARTGAANVWSVIVADPERDLVFLPTSSPAPDYFGGMRKGDNRYGNSVVALRASTGKVVWHFQTVHHDVWDFDNASPPALVTVTRNGASIPAVIQTGKSGMLFVFDRTTGTPIFPVEERAVPSSSVPGEVASPTQPFTAVVPPLVPLPYSAADAWGPTPEAKAACHEILTALRNDGPFTPPSIQGTLQQPGNIGGAHWGGVAIDERRGVVVVPVKRVPAVIQLIPAEGVNGDSLVLT